METNRELLTRILNEYDCITVNTVNNDCAEFELYGLKYAIYMLDSKAFPLVLAIDHSENYPHFLYNEKEYNGHNYRYICLFESGTLIEYIHTDEEKIRSCISRLIALVELSVSDRIAELQKEFLYYWNRACPVEGKHANYDYQLFVDNEDSYQWLEQLHFNASTIRISKRDRYFNDIEKLAYCDKTPVLYLPIIDPSKLIPPLPGAPWGAREILDIVSGVVYQRISTDAYQEITKTSYSKKEIILVFKLNSYFFACAVEFSNPGVEKLIVKFESRIVRVTPFRMSRCDFGFLNRQIGNEPIGSIVSIVGAGSLGSYIASELIKAGYYHVKIFDPDTYDFANIFRHRLPYLCSRYRKSQCLEVELRSIHPELNISEQSVSINSANVDLLQSSDIIIIAIGDSDAELQINAALKRQGITAPVFHAWLEHDGSTSHVVAIRDQKEGCFECLYTDQNGDLCPNILNRAPQEEIVYFHNGCGGTRVPYGNKTLLTATTLLLTALEDKATENRIYSFYDNHIEVSPFPKNERCHCCGIQEQIC